jgi:carbamate kinase
MISPLFSDRGVVVALGGNAILPAGERGDIHQQFAHTRSSLEPIVELARAGWRIAIVHGNGPQIGDELYRNEAARRELPPLPLGVLVAGTAGWIGLAG